MGPVPSPSMLELSLVGHVLDAGPSLKLIARSSSKMPASPAISVIGPSCLTAWRLSFIVVVRRSSAPPCIVGIPSSPTSSLPSLAVGPPAYPKVTLSAPLETVTFSGPTPAAVFCAMRSSPDAETSKSGSFTRACMTTAPSPSVSEALSRAPTMAVACTGKTEAVPGVLPL